MPLGDEGWIVVIMFGSYNEVKEKEASLLDAVHKAYRLYNTKGLQGYVAFCQSHSLHAMILLVLC